MNQLHCLITFEKPLNETNSYIHSEKQPLYTAVILVLEKQSCKFKESLGHIDKCCLKKGKKKSAKGLLYVTSSREHLCLPRGLLRKYKIYVCSYPASTDGEGSSQNSQ